ncbi:MAG: sirohydrochlorin cobaltochelatase [Prevotella sp.]|nr:sirohydrochlorin cobaltochelatase [Prevotella sp.]
MRKTFSILLMFLCVSIHAQELSSFVESNLLTSLQKDDKAALLMVHFGTTHDDTRTKTIDAINQKAKAMFPKLDVRESYTSRIIMRRLKARGISKESPLEAMLRLRAEGYTHLIIQSTNIIDGVEMESLRNDVESVKPFFKEIRVGNPLMYSTDDALRVVDILTKRIPTNAKKREHVLFVGHGTETPATAIYSEIDYMLKAEGHPNYHVGTIEGYPTFDNAVQMLKAAKAKTLILAPLMFVAGDHAKNDISQDWKENLEKEGFLVELHIEGLGEIPEIQDIFMQHIQFLMNHRVRGIMEKKAAYSTQKD